MKLWYPEYSPCEVLQWYFLCACRSYLWSLRNTNSRLPTADSTVRHPEGIAEDYPARTRDCFIPIDFMVLDMYDQKETTLILGRPFLNTVNAHIDVGAGEIRLHVNGKEEKFDFQPKKKQCLMIRVKFRSNPQKIKEVEVTPSKKDNLISFMETFMKEEQSKRPKRKGKPKITKTKDPSPVPPTTQRKAKKVWRKKKTSSSTTTPLGMDESTSA